MLTINPAPTSGPHPAAIDAASLATTVRPIASRLAPPPGAGAPHPTTLDDDIVLGIGMVGVGVLGLAALASAGAFEGVAVAAGPAIDFVTKAGTQYVTDFREIGRDLGALRHDPEGTGSFLAHKTADALVDAPGAAIVGGAFSAGAAIAWHFIESARGSHGR